MTEQPFNLGGHIRGGRVLVAPAGTKPEAILGAGPWTDIGHLASIDGIEFTNAAAGGADIRTTPRSVEHSITFEQIPPKTRREKRNRNDFMRLLWGGPLPTPVPRRQLIHNGRKP